MAETRPKAERLKNVGIELSAHQAIKACLGNSRELAGSLSNAFRWIARQDADIRSVIFDGVSPEAELRLLELLVERARAKLDAGEPIGRSAEIGRVYHQAARSTRSSK